MHLVFSAEFMATESPQVGAPNLWSERTNRGFGLQGRKTAEMPAKQGKI